MKDKSSSPFFGKVSAEMRWGFTSFELTWHSFLLTLVRMIGRIILAFGCSSKHHRAQDDCIQYELVFSLSRFELRIKSLLLSRKICQRLLKTVFPFGGQRNYLVG